MTRRPDLRIRLAMLALCVGILGLFASFRAAAASPAMRPATKVTFESDGKVLTGFLYAPEGAGPWPALVWNHGSEQNPGAGPQFDTVASVFVPAGFVVFAPERRGHGESEGAYIVTRVKDAMRLQGKEHADRLMVQLLETEQLLDQLAGFEYVKSLPFVDSERVVVAGCSFGGIETLLGAESGAGYRAAVALSPAALTWDRNEYVRDRLERAAGKIDIPTLVLQPAQDASLAPSRVLAAAAARSKKPLTSRVYPATGSTEEQQHCFGGARGMHVWAADAVEFFRAQLR